jgi:hypothetical protein
MHADRTNRTALIVFGCLVLLAGAAGMLTSVGVFSNAFSKHALFANQVSTYIGKNGAWVWPAAAAVCLLIALAALRWILVLLVSTDRAGDITLPGAKDHGTTKLPPAALTGALAGEVGSYHGVDSVRGRIIGDPASPQLVLTVTATPAADLSALHQRLESEALAHARQALGKQDLPVQLDLDVSRRSP